MSWTRFKERYLLTINISLVLMVILYALRKDFSWHPFLGIWLALTLLSTKLAEIQKKVFHRIGQVNSVLLLSLFYYFFFTPFSVIYRFFFQNRAFRKSEGRLSPKESISDFDRPF